MARQRNEGGRFSKGSDWYKQLEEANIRKIEAEWQAQHASEEYYQESDGDLVPWDRAA
jgi:ribonuclease HI